ncbi:MAG: hypothetical protein V7675_16705 [Hyphomonas sp.]|uniref:hypothetical protein n=1 Tax=Hyphomonas sp. TaxID=87 RepID=UPI0030032EC1
MNVARFIGRLFSEEEEYENPLVMLDFSNPEFDVEIALDLVRASLPERFSNIPEQTLRYWFVGAFWLFEGALESSAEKATTYRTLQKMQEACDHLRKAADALDEVASDGLVSLWGSMAYRDVQRLIDVELPAIHDVTPDMDLSVTIRITETAGEEILAGRRFKRSKGQPKNSRLLSACLSILGNWCALSLAHGSTISECFPTKSNGGQWFCVQLIKHLSENVPLRELRGNWAELTIERQLAEAKKRLLELIQKIERAESQELWTKVGLDSFVGIYLFDEVAGAPLLPGFRCSEERQIDRLDELDEWKRSKDGDDAWFRMFRMFDS